MNRTITTTLFDRLSAQAVEANRQGLSKLAEILEDQLKKNSHNLRPVDEAYLYDEESFQRDLQSTLWDAVLRVSDFYGIRRFNATDMDLLVVKVAEDLQRSICLSAGIEHGVGAYEPAVPGEMVEQITLEVDDE